MNWLELTNDISEKEKFFIPYGNIDKVKGKVVSKIMISDDKEDVKISFSDGTDLRIFGNSMLPSYI